MRSLAQCLAFVTLLLPALLEAQRRPSLRLQASYGSDTLMVRIDSARPPATCEHQLLAAPSRAALADASNPLWITANERGGARVAVPALPVLLGVDGASTTLFLRARSLCPGRQLQSRIVTVTIPRRSTGTVTLETLLASIRQRLMEPSVRLEEAFGGLSFTQPVDLQSPRDGSGRLFVVEQAGRIQVFSTAQPTSSVALDITDRVESSGSEQGLLGLAFHPRFAANRQLFVNYTREPDGATVISRFTMNESSSVIDPASELVLLSFAQPFENHNGGQLLFGGDGFLYITSGDGGSGGDPQGNGQDRSTLLGKLLRIDVDRRAPGKNYAIPRTNPFRGNGSGFREEIFAYGLRNPWRVSFDRPTGRLWIADVGQGLREEINIGRRGANYGWNTMEGSLCFADPNCSQAGLTLPVHEYPRSIGQSVTGGYVYRGTTVAGLRGIYLFGDFVSGRLFGLRHTPRRTDLLNLGEDDSLLPSSFGIGEDGEVYVLSYGSGKIFRFVE